MACVTATVTSPDVQLIGLLTCTPIDADSLNINLSVTFKRTGNPLRDGAIAWFIMRQIKQEFERDITVWEDKAYLTDPVLSVGDGPVVQLRRWAQQFYPPVTMRSSAADGA